MSKDHQTALHSTTTGARDPCCYISCPAGVLYDVVGDVSTILKVTGKQVPGDVDFTKMFWYCGWTLESTGGGDLIEPTELTMNHCI